MSASLSTSQNGSRSGWVGDRSPAAVDGTITAAQPRRSRPQPTASPAGRIDQRDVRDRQQSIVVGAEVGHGLVLCRAAGVEAIDVPAAEQGAGERGEHQLALEPEQVEHPAAFGGSNAPSACHPLSTSSRSSAAAAVAGSARRCSARATASSSTGFSASIPAGGVDHAARAR